MKIKKRVKRKIARIKKNMRVVRKIKVRDAKVPLEVPLERAFWVNNGPVVRSLKELYNAITSMSQQQYDFHTLRSGNDFARWVHDILLDPECADRIEAAKNQKDALKAISKSL